MDKDIKLAEILKTTQPQALLDHLIGEVQSIQGTAKSLEEILMELRSQSRVDSAVQKAAKQD